MVKKYIPYPIEYDETRKCLKVKLKGREINDVSERDAQLISNIPCLYERLEFNDNSSQHDDCFINNLQQTVEIMNNYRIGDLNWMTRKIQSEYKKISQEYQPW